MHGFLKDPIPFITTESKQKWMSEVMMDTSIHNPMEVSDEREEMSMKLDGTINSPIIPSATTFRSDWLSSYTQDIPSDVTIEVGGGISFALHKFPLLSKSGYIRKLLAQVENDDGKGDNDPPRIELLQMPGRSEAFELVAKFCYGGVGGFEITVLNVAMLRCAAEYLEMTDEYAKGNLIRCTESFLSDFVFRNLLSSIAVLHQCEQLLPVADEEPINIVSRCVDVIASLVFRAGLKSISDLSTSSRFTNYIGGNRNNLSSTNYMPREQWMEDLSLLNIGLYRRVMNAMRAKGVRYDILGHAIVRYAQRWLRGRGITRKHFLVQDATTIRTNTFNKQEQRVLVETIVSLFPLERLNYVPISFLFGLLRIAIRLETTFWCRLELEKRIGLQLERASLDDLIIPTSHSFIGDTLFDIETIHRIVVNFMQQYSREKDSQEAFGCLELDRINDHLSQNAIKTVSRLLDCFLAEIAPDANLRLDVFISLVGLMPKHTREVDDGLYRAIDIYLKAHPSLTELERKKICGLIDCGKLSENACGHASKNDRLPIEMVVQVLYFEQARLRKAMQGALPPRHSTTLHRAISPVSSQISAMSSNDTSTRPPLQDNNDVGDQGFAILLQRENLELKMEVARMQLHLLELEKKPTALLSSNKKGEEKLALIKLKLLRTFSKNLRKLNPFKRTSGSNIDSSSSISSQNLDGVKHPRARRYSAT